MPTMSWPDVPCPPGDPVTTARNVLDYIINKAMMDKPPNEAYVVALALNCKLNAHPNPPPDHDHSVHVARAKFFADAGQWFQAASELEHGV